MQKQGVQIHLHCFDYGRGKQANLEKYCASVHYYERFTGHTSITNKLPYIVSSRRNESLLARLLQDDHPILMEGIHCTYLLNDPRFIGRKCFVRLHNVEYQYYRELSRNASLSFRKLYYGIESWLLRRYEKKIANKAVFFSVTTADAIKYSTSLHCGDISTIPVFLPDWKLVSKEGPGNYCLYQGDLGVDTNEKAAIWLLQKVFSKIELPLVIAGKNPSVKLETLVKENPRAVLIGNPSQEQMQTLIADAQIHLLPSYTTTGIKLKLLNALFNGRHCVVTPETVEGTELESTCHIAASANNFAEIIELLYHQRFMENDILVRKELLQNRFDNCRNAELIVKKIWG
ncbi:glycosyltransferase [Sediminibacterium soli]|uniref:glycosyltransferase n=1 Tax=Sediminibacterium soli TaxID=2698829 RepID=UPI001F376E5F|nr:glycosyltransferase family 4 protein [Sediminibacterium soli]